MNTSNNNYTPEQAATEFGNLVNSVSEILANGMALGIESMELLKTTSNKLAKTLKITPLQASNVVRLGMHNLSVKYGKESLYNNFDLKTIIGLAI